MIPVTSHNPLIPSFAIYPSKDVPFPGLSPSRSLITHLPASCSPTNPLLLPCSSIPSHCSIESFRDQGPLLPLMSNKAILCCLCVWRHG